MVENLNLVKYIGENCESYTLNEIYEIVDLGYHWEDKNKEDFGMFVTSNENPYTDDVDYCIFIGSNNFNKKFKGVKEPTDLEKVIVWLQNWQRCLDNKNISSLKRQLERYKNAGYTN